jgi:hypothetical protein
MRGDPKGAMPQSPREHALEREATNHIRTQLPAEWICDEVTHDYGRDLIYQIVTDGEVTGLEFRIQSKGHEVAHVVYGDRIAQPLRVATLNYFDRGMLPVLLAVYDSSQRRTYFEWVQKSIEEQLDPTRHDWRSGDANAEITLHLPIGNVLAPEIGPAIVEYVDRWRAYHGLAGGLPSDRLRAYLAHKARLLRFDFQTTPPEVTRFIHRKSLCEITAKHLIEHVVFLEGGAGYGKTWGALQAANEMGLPVVWYEIEERDHDPLHFVEGLAIAVLRASEPIGQQTLAYISERTESATAEEGLALLLEELEEADAEISLVVEQCENAGDDVATLVSTMIERLSKKCHCILTGRTLVTPFRKLVSTGLIVVLDESNLRWSEQETADYLNNLLALNVAEEACRELHERTEGWPAATAMAGRLLGQGELHWDEIRTGISGHDGAIYEYFAANVYQGLAKDLAASLRRLAFLREFDADAMDCVTGGSDGGARLNSLRHEVSFVSSTQGSANSCRIHPLFREYLQQRMVEEEGEQEARAVKALLAKHMLEKGKWITAIELAAEAKAEETAIRALEEVAPLLAESGMGAFLLDLLELLPDGWAICSPRIQEAIAVAAGAHLPVPQAITLVENAIEMSSKTGNAIAAERLRLLQLELRSKQGEIDDPEYVDGISKIVVALRDLGHAFLADQAELRRIESQRADAIGNPVLLDQLIDDVQELVDRQGTDSSAERQVRGNALGLLGRLICQRAWSAFVSNTTLLRVKEAMGFEEDIETRVLLARETMDNLAASGRLYVEALGLLTDTDELAKAHMELAWIHDRVDVVSALLVSYVGSSGEGRLQEIHARGLQVLAEILPLAGRCEAALARLRSHEGLASLYIELSRLHALSGNEDERVRFAMEAAEIAEQFGYARRLELAKKLASGEVVPDFLSDHSEDEWENRLAQTTDAGLEDFAATILQGFENIADESEVQVAVMRDVVDMRDSARVRGDWCRHIYVLQDLRHTHSRETIYREIPDRKIVCTELDEALDIGKAPFDERWETFKGYYCLGCTSREPRGLAQL